MNKAERKAAVEERLQELKAAIDPFVSLSVDPPDLAVCLLPIPRNPKRSNS